MSAGKHVITFSAATTLTNLQVFGFLTLFPYRSTITNSVTSGEATLENLLPPGKFYQAKYAVQAIHSKLKDQLHTVSRYSLKADHALTVYSQPSTKLSLSMLLSSWIVLYSVQTYSAKKFPSLMDCP